MEIAAQGTHGVEVAAGSATEAEVDAAGIQRCEGAELFCDDEGRVVGQHDASTADADGVGGGGHVADEDGCGGAGEALDGVMLGKPEAAIAPLLGVVREINGAGDGGRGGFAGAHADEV